MIKLGIWSGIAGALGVSDSVSSALNILTPDEVAGPFYPTANQQDKDSDLTKINGQKGLADGTHIIVAGQITDIAGDPIENATVDIWQANAKGRYRHPNDPNPAPIDLKFQGWAIIASGKNGEFRFKTVMPGAYPASQTWIRPPHIHFKISRPGYAPLITQMYFPGEQLNQTDLLLRNKKAPEQPLMIAKNIGKEGKIVIYQHNIVMT